jgi:hypothetical protein
MINSKKAQLTVFIVIGVVIILGLLIFFLFRTTNISTETKAIEAQEVPVTFQPLKDYIDSCIDSVSKEAITQLGMHGGYISLADYGLRARIDSPTQSSAFFFDPSSTDTGIVYWNYFASDNRCETGCSCGSEKPFLRKSDGSPNMERQIQDYIDDNLKSCLRDFISFKRQGINVISSENVKSSVTIRDVDVLVEVNYLVEADKNNNKFEIEDFIRTLDVPLAAIYVLASNIADAEKNNSYLERWTVEQISGLGLGMKQERLPPIAAFELDPSIQPTYWIKQAVSENIKNNMLPVYTPLLSVYGSKNYNYNLMGTFYERATLPLSSEDVELSNFDVTFNYRSWWPIYFDVTGRGIRGQRIGPETMSSSFFSFIGLQRYNFYYDLSYPVLVDIYNEWAFNREGFHFYFGMESNVRNNDPINCSGPGATRYAFSSASLFCNEEEACASVNINTKDGKTGAALDGVKIFYSSGRESCDKGMTSINQAKASATSKLPQCVGSGCSLQVVKDGYFYNPTTYAVRCGISNACSDSNVLCDGESLDITLEPYRYPNVTVMKKKMIKQGEKKWTFNNAAEALLSNEYAVITLNKIKGDESEPDFTQMGTYYGNGSSINLMPGLVPGNYEARIDMFYVLPDSRNRNQIYFQSVEECESGVLGIGEECATIGPYNITQQTIEGGFAGNISITKEMIDNYQNLIFYVISVPDFDTSASVLDAYDLEEITKRDQYIQENYVALKPVVS